MIIIPKLKCILTVLVKLNHSKSMRWVIISDNKQRKTVISLQTYRFVMQNSENRKSKEEY
jgi:hypothetical protein